MADVDRCVCCGEIVPEGRQVCPRCENGAEQNGNKKTTYREELIDLIIEAKKTDPKTEGFTNYLTDYTREEAERALKNWLE